MRIIGDCPKFSTYQHHILKFRFFLEDTIVYSLPKSAIPKSVKKSSGYTKLISQKSDIRFPDRVSAKRIFAAATVLYGGDYPFSKAKLMRDGEAHGEVLSEKVREGSQTDSVSFLHRMVQRYGQFPDF